MRIRPGMSLALVAALALTTAIAPVAGAGTPVRRARPAPLTSLQTFAVSGEFSGPLGGELHLAGGSYRLAIDATMYEIGRGTLARGTVVSARMVCLTGVMRGGVPVVHSVIVRPEAEALGTGGSPAAVGVLDPASPR